MNEFILTTLQAVITAAVPVIVAFLCVLIRQKAAEIKEKVTYQKTGSYLYEAADAVATAVAHASQTYVDALKKQGAFSVENQKEAFSLAYEKAVSLLSEEAKAFIISIYGDLSEYLTLRIEAQVRRQKTD